MEPTSMFLRTAGAMALVLGLFFACIYALRRWGNLTKKTVSQSLIEVLSKRSFGPRHHLILVKIAGEHQILVGVSPQNMSFLSMNASALNGEVSFEDVIKKI